MALRTRICGMPGMGRASPPTAGNMLPQNQAFPGRTQSLVQG